MKPVDKLGKVLINASTLNKFSFILIHKFITFFCKNFIFVNFNASLTNNSWNSVTHFGIKSCICKFKHSFGEILKTSGKLGVKYNIFPFKL